MDLRWLDRRRAPSGPEPDSLEDRMHPRVSFPHPAPGASWGIRRILVGVLALLSMGAAPAAAQEAAAPPVAQVFDWHLEREVSATTPWGQPVDVEATRLILSWTTAEEFTNPLVDHLPTAAGVVSPMEHFGYPLGKPGVLHTSSEFYAWYEALAASSDRVRMEYLNETEEGRRFALVQVGSPENLARLEEIRHRNAAERGRREAPHGWVVPQEQLRKADVAHMLNLLRSHGVELHRASGERTLGEGEEAVDLRRGDYVIRADQPYGPFVRNLMEVQRFPEDAPRPYDDMAWTFPLLYNVEVREVGDPRVLETGMTPVTEAVSIPGRLQDLSGRGAVGWWVIRYEATAHGLQARWELGGDRPVYAAREGVEAEGGIRFGPGSWLLPAGDFSREEVQGWAERWGLEAAGVSAAALEGIARRRQTLPRIALLHIWQNTQDDGAVRYALETMEIPYTYLPEDRLGDGGLRDRFDVILFPEQGRNARGRQIFEGLDPAHGPLPWEPHPDFPSIGSHSTTPDMTGGMGCEGLAALRDFVEAGGTLVALGSAATLPVELGLVRDVSLRDPGALFSPGSIVQARAARADHPILWGHEEEFPVFDRFGPYVSVSGDRGEDVVLRYAPVDRVFLNGLVLGREGLGGHPAVLSVPRGEGTVVLFGVRTLHRNQTRGSFALARNAVLNWEGLSEPPPVAVATQDEAAGGAP